MHGYLPSAIAPCIALPPVSMQSTAWYFFEYFRAFCGFRGQNAFAGFIETTLPR